MGNRASVTPGKMLHTLWLCHEAEYKNQKVNCYRRFKKNDFCSWGRIHRDTGEVKSLICQGERHSFIGRCILLLGFLPSNRAECVLGNDKKSLVDEKGALR